MPRKRVCVYNGCTSYTTDKKNDVHLYSFPADVERRAVWVNCAANPDRLTDLGCTYRNTFLCEHHFDEKWFFDARKNKLNTGAVPRPYVPPSPNPLNSITSNILVETPAKSRTSHGPDPSSPATPVLAKTFSNCSKSSTTMIWHTLRL